MSANRGVCLVWVLAVASACNPNGSVASNDNQESVSAGVLGGSADDQSVTTGATDPLSEDLSSGENAAAEAADPTEPAPGWQRATDDPRAEAATAARMALAGTLQARLMETMQASGPLAAMDVCSQEAQQLTARVGQEHGVRIGRTAARRRNVANTVPPWAGPFVDAQSYLPVQLVGPGDIYAELHPIFVGAPCLQCHGAQSDLADGVAEAIAERYPADEATGFGAGDLRGWFWVEVDPT